jgi:hypothetical protein
MNNAIASRAALTCTVAAFWLATASDQADANTTHIRSEWRFNVSLDGKSVGYHFFQLIDRGTQRELTSEARFNVKVLFINVYHYAHNNTELWQDECVAQIDAHTDDNGTRKVVHGALTDAHFVIAVGNRSTDLAPCVMTFAYWNPKILEATHLLNQQTGEYVPVYISRIGTDNYRYMERRYLRSIFTLLARQR